jgi:muconolactone D-isomerase
VEFLVAIQANLPGSMTEEERANLLAKERVRAFELRRAGTVQRMWRIPGRFANVGVWVADDATELHNQIASLPLFRWLDVQVTALARHYVETDEC